eukprot:CAMPEP_0195109590 /NCGR_PEP_ID=MMETSP0448-20130528/89885_1 /TAXON_ID=66468 /ORGANISM="Heterocapsa triquestra, Strain CCMP 448" /LENGTH=71 /DNA_ID=CAMNT_0040146221 /DNA_START=15 /DNA_END=227 /DNA_ORIENTATION=+
MAARCVRVAPSPSTCHAPRRTLASPLTCEYGAMRARARGEKRRPRRDEAGVFAVGGGLRREAEPHRGSCHE